MLRSLGREARTVVISVVASALVVGVPATAAVIATNSDKVDGRHAVGAGASVNFRKGKLVATNGVTGRLPNNIIAKPPNADRLDGVDSSGFLRGVKMRTGSDFTITAGGSQTGSASCLSGEFATGGGVYPRTNPFGPRITASFPTPNPDLFTAPDKGTAPTGWRVWVTNEDLSSSISMTPYVLCISARR